MKAQRSPVPNGGSSSPLTDARVEALDDWQGRKLSQLRAVIESADPEVSEEAKWKKPTNSKGVSAWSRDGLICTGAILKNAVRLTFAKGAQMKDPMKLFNASLEGNALRAIDFHEGDNVDETALRPLILEAIRLNTLKTPWRVGIRKDRV